VTTKYQLRIDDVLWEIVKSKDLKYEQNSDIAWRGFNFLSKVTLKPPVWLRCGKSTRYSIICSWQVELFYLVFYTVIFT